MKAHIVNAEDPIQFGMTIEASCGVFVQNPVPKFMVDTNFDPSATFNSLLVCRRCREHAHSFRYIYGVVNGQELKHGEG